MVFALGTETVLLIVVLVAVPLAAILFAGAGGALKEIGRGSFAMEHEEPRRAAAPAPVPRAVQAEEVRQMLQARSDRQVARGEPPLDVEAEAGKLLGSSTPAGHDRALREEVRQLVIARNERRLRKGEEPLDVEAEVDRQLRDLS